MTVEQEQQYKPKYRVYNVDNFGPVQTYSTRIDSNLPKRIVTVDSPNTLRVFSSRMRALLYTHTQSHKNILIHKHEHKKKDKNKHVH